MLLAGAGRERHWDRDIWRIDSALTYRFDRHPQGKLQYGYGRQTGGLQQGEQLVAARVTVRFSSRGAVNAVTGAGYASLLSRAMPMLA